MDFLHFNKLFLDKSKIQRRKKLNQKRNNNARSSFLTVSHIKLNDNMIDMNSNCVLTNASKDHIQPKSNPIKIEFNIVSDEMNLDLFTDDANTGSNSEECNGIVALKNETNRDGRFTKRFDELMDDFNQSSVHENEIPTMFSEDQIDGHCNPLDGKNMINDIKMRRFKSIRITFNINIPSNTSNGTCGNSFQACTGVEESVIDNDVISESGCKGESSETILSTIDENGRIYPKSLKGQCSSLVPVLYCNKKNTSKSLCMITHLFKRLSVDNVRLNINY